MSDDGRLTLGVIGAGAWAAFAHIPGFLRRPEVVPLIVNRRDLVQLEALRARFDFERATKMSGAATGIRSSSATASGATASGLIRACSAARSAWTVASARSSA